MQNESIQSKGGKARAESLSSEKKKEIAEKAALARWGKPLIQYQGEIALGTATIPCAVAEIDGEMVRLINSAGFMKAIGRPWKGTYKRTVRPNFLDAPNLDHYITDELSAVLELIECRTESGGTVRGYRAEIVPLACEVYLMAREDNALHQSQLKIAKACEIIMRSLAKLGIMALVDEATGYQEVRVRR